MMCPYCNKEMERGFVQSRDGLHWTPKRQMVSALSGLGRGAVLIGSNNSFVPNTTAIAYHCEECKCVIIPYGEEENI